MSNSDTSPDPQHNTMRSVNQRPAVVTRLRRNWWGISLAIVLIIYAAVLRNHAAYAVGGADSSGYVSNARRLLQGRVVQPVPELMRLGVPEQWLPLFVPLGYTWGPRAGTIVCFYPVGASLHMALGAWLGGWDYGPFLVGPLAVTFSLLLIYLLARELSLSRWYALAVAAMLAVCPTVIFLGVQPVSDVLAMCWALLAVWAAWRTQRRAWWGLWAGAAFGVGFLVRPLNLLMLLPLLLALRPRPRVWLYFGLGGLPLAFIFFAYNYVAFGHPLQTGYGVFELHNLITTTGAWTRLQLFVSWLAVLATPLLLLGWLGLAIDRRVSWRVRALLLGWFGAFLIFYSCYNFFSGWDNTRFLLPGLPALILGALLAVRDCAELVSRRCNARVRGWVRGIIGAAVSAMVIGWSAYQVAQLNVLPFGRSQMWNAHACRAADRLLPERALVLTGELSGAFKFYTARPIVRWDQVLPEHWPLLRERAAQTGHRWYALLIASEVESAQQHIPGEWRRLGDMRHFSLWQIEP